MREASLFGAGAPRPAARFPTAGTPARTVGKGDVAGSFRSPDGHVSAIPAITLWQAWASLVAAGAKPYEFRRWPAPPRLWGKRIAIHAGARPIRRAEVDELLATLQLEGGWGTALKVEPATEILLRVQADPTCLPLSHVLCTAVLGKPVPANEIELERLATNGFVGDSDRIDHQMFGWPLTDIEPLVPPVPATGRQGFWLWRAAL